MNRHDRRTRGKAMVQRLNVLKNSSLLKAIDYNSLPKETMDSLIADTCEDKDLQKTYNKCKKLLDEMMQIEVELYNANVDLEKKRKGLDDTPKENISNVN